MCNLWKKDNSKVMMTALCAILFITVALGGELALQSLLVQQREVPGLFRLKWNRTGETYSPTIVKVMDSNQCKVVLGGRYTLWINVTAMTCIDEQVLQNVDDKVDATFAVESYFPIAVSTSEACAESYQYEFSADFLKLMDSLRLMKPIEGVRYESFTVQPVSIRWIPPWVRWTSPVAFLIVVIVMFIRSVTIEKMP